jgi:pyrroline-5-carboxylate reductase
MSEDNPQTPPAAPRVAILGGGVMGGTIVTALRVAGWPQDKIVVAERESVRAGALREGHGIEVFDSVAEAVTDADIIVIAVKPNDTAAALEQVKPVQKDGAMIFTVVAGLGAEYYESRLAPGTPVVRAMPNTPSIVARGATAIAAGTHATDEHLALATGMLRATGLVVTVPESQLDAVTAVSGSGPAYFYAMVEALTEAGVAQGLDRVLSTQLAAQTFVGAAHLLMESGDTPQTLRRRVSSPGGTTIAALEALEHAGLQGVISAGANAASARSKELAAELEG